MLPLTRTTSGSVVGVRARGLDNVLCGVCSLGGDDHLAGGQEVARHTLRFADEPAPVIAQVEDDPLGAAPLQGGDRLMDFRARALGE